MAAAQEAEEPTATPEEPPTRACANCRMDDGHNKRCGGCQNIFYCSSECQRLDRQRHKGECKQANLSKFLDAVRAMQ